MQEDEDQDEYNQFVKLNINEKIQELISSSQMRPDHQNRPILLTSTRYIYVETYNNFYKQYRSVYEFLISIADPLNRP